MNRYDLIVFDWDGTVLDSAGAIVMAIQAACRDLNLPVPDEAAARHVIGLGLGEALRQAVPSLPPERYSEMVERYRSHYLSTDHELDLFEGIAELLSRLRSAGKSLAVATGKSRIGLDRALRHSGLEIYFVASRCADECFSKPHPQMLEELMAELGVPAERTLMIGDTSHDLLMARNAGVDGLAVAYGAHPGRFLLEHGPVACVDTVAELSLWLQQNA
ncbi:MAG: HAD-IA family hydrolase [Dechloromonas sp.]|nr:HAD-IA family hydrolase [Dechloromonas sp.]